MKQKPERVFGGVRLMTAGGTEVFFTRRPDSIPVESKISLDRFMRICWENSRTNLHYVDFKRVFGDDLKRMFRPVNVGHMDTKTKPGE